MLRRSVWVCVGLWLLVSVAACGKKAPPLAPLNMAPAAPAPIVARRLGDTVYLELTVPAASSTGLGPYSIDHLDVYAVTLAAGSIYPANRDLFKPKHVIAKIAVAPPADLEEAEPETETRPRPGEVITFVEALTPAALVPQEITKPPKPPKPVKPPKAGTVPPPPPPVIPLPAGAVAAPPAPTGPLVLTRMYVVRGVSSNRNVGLPTARLEVPLLAAPGAVRVGRTPPTWDETSVTVSWDPPATTSDEAPGVTYNVYALPAAGAAAVVSTDVSAGTAAKVEALTKTSVVLAKAPVPLNLKPLGVTTFVHDGAAPGKEQCFVVRSVAAVGGPVPGAGAPVGVAAAPVGVPAAPVSVAAAPVGVPAAPVGAPAAPVGVLAAPVGAPAAGVLIESDPSDPICLTPQDIFAPAAPKGLQAVGSAGVINLIWDANSEADLGGYLVLRGAAPGDTLQPLTPEPIRETRYQDRSTRPGVTYVYAIVAVDRAVPPNTSGPSNRVQETAR